MGNERLDDYAHDKGNKKAKIENLFGQNYLLIKVTEKQNMVIKNDHGRLLTLKLLNI